MERMSLKYSIRRLNLKVEQYLEERIKRSNIESAKLNDKIMNRGYCHVFRSTK